MLTNRFYSDGDGTGTPNNSPSNGDNSVIRTLREEINTLKSEREAFKTKLTEVEREKMGELQRLQAERDDALNLAKDYEGTKQNLGKLSEEKQNLVKFIDQQYHNKLEALPEDRREKIKQLTYADNDPIASLSKLEAAIELLGGDDGKAGTVTNPASNRPPAMGKPDTKIDPLKIGWGDALTPSSDLISQRNQMNRRGN
jgi:hypothetical protein